jgi:acyl-homoserine-lactone acylase
VVTWNNSPCPNAATILTYSQSTNLRSAHLADQTALFSAKKWVTNLFCAAAVRAATLTTTMVAAGRRTITSSAHRRPASRRPRHRR